MNSFNIDRIARHGREADLCCYLNSIHDFAPSTTMESVSILSERDFQTVIVASKTIQRQLGWNSVVCARTAFPDLIVEICGEKTRVELEYDARNFLRHRHPVVGLDLVLSFMRPVGMIQCGGVPVLSFYRFELGSHNLTWTLDDDMNEFGW